MDISAQPYVNASLNRLRTFMGLLMNHEEALESWNKAVEIDIISELSSAGDFIVTLDAWNAFPNDGEFFSLFHHVGIGKLRLLLA